MNNAIAERDATARKLAPAEEFKLFIHQRAGEFAPVLPAHITVEKFQRTVLTAVASNPDLLSADRRSLWNSCMKAAQDGLLPDGREGALVIYNTKVKIGGQEKWVKMVQWLPMVAGILKKIRQSGEVKSITAHAVYENDHFEYELGDEEFIRHKPTNGEPGEVVGAYCIAILSDGMKIRDYMPRWRIERARQQSKSPNGLMWSKFYDEGAMKTVIKHASKYLPQSTDIDAIFSRDEGMVASQAAHVFSLPQTASAPANAANHATAQIEQRHTIDETIPFADRDADIVYQDQPSDAAPLHGATAESPVNQAAGSEAAAEYDEDGVVIDDDPRAERVTEIITSLTSATTIVDLNSRLSKWGRDIDALPDDMQAEIHGAAEARRAELAAK